VAVVDRTLPVAGVIEGFYGQPWSWSDRRHVAQFAGERGMTHYVWAPKDDPRHRSSWTEPHDVADLAGFEAIVTDGHVRLGYGISPVDIQVGDPAHLGALWAKVLSGVERGASLVVLCLDDIPARPGLGADHAGLVRWMYDRLDERADLALVPTHYAGASTSQYLEAIVDGVPAEIPNAWTGPAVVNDRIGAADARARSAVVGGRKPLLWDNAVANDGVMGDRLPLGPLSGRDPEVRQHLSGYLLNGSCQPRATCLPLASVAAWCAGRDPTGAWQQECAGLEVLAQGCVGTEVVALVDDVLEGGSSRALRRLLDAAVSYQAPADLAAEVAPWVDQLHEEAAVSRAALDVLEGAGDPATLLASLLFRWPRLARADVSVFGPRRASQLHLTQDERLRFAPAGQLFVEDVNATDRLVRAALALAGPA
jgi:hypothetical protein